MLNQCSESTSIVPTARFDVGIAIFTSGHWGNNNLLLMRTHKLFFANFDGAWNTMRFRGEK